MRRGHIVLVGLLSLTTAASAQTPAPPVATSEIVVARILSFDRDRDDHVTKEELPERMRNLFSNDVNGDGVLDRTEIARAIPTMLLPATATGPGFPRGGGYTFGDQVSLSSRAHVEGALDDLRLDNLTREQALDVVRPFMTTLEKNAAATLVQELRPLLSASQLDSFKTTLNRQMSAGTAGDALLPPPFNRAFRIFPGEPNLTQRVAQSGLETEQARQAVAAIDRFKATIRPGDAERAALLEQLTGVLNDEQRDDFGAALARRPLVKASMPPGFNIDIVVPGRVGGRAVLIRPTLPPQPVTIP